MNAAYIEAHRNGRLGEAVDRASRWVRKCTLCPRMCKVDRMAGERVFAKQENWRWWPATGRITERSGRLWERRFGDCFLFALQSFL